jgi:hypothetical protein
MPYSKIITGNNRQEHRDEREYHRDQDRTKQDRSQYRHDEHRADRYSQNHSNVHA